MVFQYPVLYKQGNLTLGGLVFVFCKLDKKNNKCLQVSCCWHGTDSAN